jgi:MYXO-CTERM domain-containing protein
VTIDENDLVWDFNQARSNYTQLFRQGIDAAGGAAWVAEFASPMANLWFEAFEEAEVARGSNKFPYLTRLRTNVNVDNLDRDLLLAPSADASNLRQNLFAPNGVNLPPPRQCPDYDGDGRPDSFDDERLGVWDGLGCACDARGAGGAASAIPFGLAVALGLAWTRRRRRR